MEFHRILYVYKKWLFEKSKTLYYIEYTEREREYCKLYNIYYIYGNTPYTPYSVPIEHRESYFTSTTTKKEESLLKKYKLHNMKLKACELARESIVLEYRDCVIRSVYTLKFYVI